MGTKIGIAIAVPDPDGGAPLSPAPPVNVSPPVVTGTPEKNETLTCSPGSWTGFPFPTFEYQWRRNSVDIGGEDNQTYVVQAADIGNNIDCVVTALNSEGTASAPSNSVLILTTFAPTNLTPPVVSGSTGLGDILSTTDGTWDASPAPTFEYQWLRGGVPISGETANNYTIVLADDAAFMSCEVVATNGSGSSAPEASNSVQVDDFDVPDAFTVGQWSVAPGDMEATVTVTTLPAANPAITGIDYRVDGGSWINSGISAPGTFDITGLTNGVTYTIEIRAVNAVGPGLDSDDKTVIPAGLPAPVNITPPVVTGTGYNGQTLTTTDGTWTNSPTGFAYQWQSNSVDIPGETNSTYTVDATTHGTSLTCEVIASNGTGSSLPALSNTIRNFVPNDLASTQVWQEAFDSANMSLSGSNVTQWDDLSGNGNNATQGASSKQPIYDSVNGLITFDGIDDAMYSNPITGSYGTNGPLSLFFFGRNIDPNTRHMASIIHDTWSSGKQFGFSPVTTGGVDTFPTMRYQNGRVSSDVNATSNDFLLGASYQTNHGGTVMRVNGANTTETANNPTNTLSFTGNPAEVLGAQGGLGVPVGSENDFANCEMKVICFFDSFISQSDTEKLEGYAAHLYGVQGTSILPPGHPYKTNPPTP